MRLNCILRTKQGHHESQEMKMLHFENDYLGMVIAAGKLELSDYETDAITI